MKEKIMGLMMVVGMASLFVLPGELTEATDLKGQKKEVESKISEVQSNLSEAEQELADILSEIDGINENIERNSQAIEDNQATMDKTEEEIASTNQEVEVLEVEIVELEKDIEKRFNLLRDRANAYQKQGSSSRYLEVILGSESFSDFVSRVFTISRIAQADTEFIDKLEENQLELEKKQETVQKKLDELNDLYTEMEGMVHHLEDQQDQNNNLKEELVIKEKRMDDMITSLVTEDENLNSEVADIQARIEAEQLRIAEAAAESEAEEVATTSSTTTSGDSSDTTKTKTTTSDNTAVAPSSSGGSLTQVGRKYIGKSTYVFGGGRSSYDVANGRFDCSGFVGWAFSQVGKSVPYSTDGLVNAGKRISLSEARVGDLVFFDTYKKNGHVAIYLGGGSFIGSQSSTGVAVASMNSGYWAKNFKGVVVRMQ